MSNHRRWQAAIVELTDLSPLHDAEQESWASASAMQSLGNRAPWAKSFRLKVFRNLVSVIRTEKIVHMVAVLQWQGLVKQERKLQVLMYEDRSLVYSALEHKEIPCGWIDLIDGCVIAFWCTPALVGVDPHDAASILSTKGGCHDG